MITGQRVWLCFGSQTIHGQVMFGSDNRKSLLIKLDEPLRTASGGMYVDLVPLMQDEKSGEYRDLFEGNTMRVHWEQEKAI